MADCEGDRDLILRAALEAGEIGLSHFRNSRTRVWYKNGNSPVTEADKEIDHHLQRVLMTARPDHGWLSEEIEDTPERLERKRVFIVDPIDGTRGFVDGDPKWCISIAVVEDGVPVAGVLHCPALSRTLHAGRGEGIVISGTQSVARAREQRPLVTGSKKLIREIDGLADNPFAVTGFIPSLAYRLGMVATGELDGAFARQGASEWDIAAADVILEESGCCLVDADGNRLVYNQRQTSAPALVAAHRTRKNEILTLAKSHGILQ